MNDVAINLSKGSSPISLVKGRAIRVTITWPPRTDYDVGAEVLYTDGRTESIATFAASGTPARSRSTDGLIRHQGDVRRSGAINASEIVDVTLSDEILAVVPWAYSAQSNGTGSFRRYAVAMEVTDGTDTVRVDASAASDDDHVYTCVPGMITNLPGEGPRVHHLELYSRPSNENRPRVRLRSRGLLKSRQLGVHVEVDGGPRNVYK